ncbi:FkbM family methyltransferase [Vibrio fluvialis]
MFVVDVGANFGEFSIDIAKRNKSIQVISIEPIIKLVDDLNNKLKESNINNVDVFQFAIDVERRVTEINVATHHDWGVSSLLNFSDEKLKEEYWATREDMYFSEKQRVQVVPLSEILNQYDISEKKRIKFIKIDAQGLDLQVLMSSGDYIDYIDSGMLEVSVTTSLGLYDGEIYDLRAALNWLDENGFEAYALKPNDPASNEFNLYFNRKGLDYKVIESELSLRGINLYDDKFYWHFPSNKFLNIEGEYISLKNENVKLGNDIKNKNNELTNKIASLELTINRLTDRYSCINSDVKENFPKINSVEDFIFILKNKKTFRLLMRLYACVFLRKN